jgi:hypothetical protein
MHYIAPASSQRNVFVCGTIPPRHPSSDPRVTNDRCLSRRFPKDSLTCRPARRPFLDAVDVPFLVARNR